MDYLLRQKNQYASINRENRRFSDLRLDLAKRSREQQELRVNTQVTCHPQYVFDPPGSINRKPHYVIWDLRNLIAKYQPWLDLVFDELIPAQEFIFEFASVEVERDINESLFNFLYERCPYATYHQLDQVQLVSESIIEDFYSSLREAMILFGLPEYLDFVLLKFIDPHSAVFKITVS